MIYLVEMQTIEGTTIEVLEAYETYPSAERRVEQLLHQTYDTYSVAYRVVAMRVRKDINEL